jgi:hypothetical protein
MTAGENMGFLFKNERDRMIFDQKAQELSEKL